MLSVAVFPGILINSLNKGRISAARNKPGNYRIKISLNAYTFNNQLVGKQMSVDGLLEYAASLNFDAIDLTAYYLPGYPNVPSTDIINRIKRKAFLLGLDISGTGIRNDFTWPDIDERAKSFRLIEEWVPAAASLGAPVIRIFAGNNKNPDFSWEQTAEWMIDAFRKCAEMGKKYGVMIALQNHADFIQTADQFLWIREQVDSEWFGLMVDIGSFQEKNAYEETEVAAPYAISWQIKDRLTLDGKLVETDVPRIINIIKKAGYRGYIPLEIIGEENPEERLITLLKQVKLSLSSDS